MVDPEAAGPLKMHPTKYKRGTLHRVQYHAAREFPEGLSSSSNQHIAVRVRLEIAIRSMGRLLRPGWRVAYTCT